MLRIFRLTLASGLSVVALALSGCGTEATEVGEPPTRPADVTGTVTQVDRQHDRRQAIVIDRGEACELVIYIDGDSRLLRGSGDARTQASLDDLAAGQTVDAWVGAIAESCPEQTRADAIVIVDAPA
jgi:hypothetical protein